MSRARNIKPKFFKNELLGECNPLARLLFAGLWCEADREGRLEDRPKRLKAEYLPYDACDVVALLDELAARGFVRRYSVEGVAYIVITTFGKHQNPHKNETPSTFPGPPEIASAHDEDGAPTDKIGIPRESIGSTPDITGTAPADSFNLIPDSPILIPDCSLRPSGLCTSDDVQGKTDEAGFALATALKVNGHHHAQSKRAPCPVAAIVELYHDLLPTCRHVEKITQARAGAIRQRWRDDLPSLEAWRRFFAHVSTSDFLTGRAPPTPPRRTPFRADIGWLTTAEHFTQIAEGKYHESIH